MHMCLWFGYEFGPFLFEGIKVVTKSGLAVTCVTLFIVGFLFEGSKVYVAQTQRNATRRLFPFKRNDERRNLLAAGTSQSGSRVQPTISLPKRILINLYQTLLYFTHNVVGYLLMLAVMVYNLWVILAIVLGMILGYFVFGPMLTKLQTECFVNSGPACTEKCDDNAEGSTPPLLHTSLSSDFLICQTPSCSRRADPAPTTSAQVHAPPAGCYYGAGACPSKVAVAEKLRRRATGGQCERDERKNSSVEDTMLLPEESCCDTSTPPLSLSVIKKADPSQSECCSSRQNDAESDETETCKPEDKIDEVSSRDALETSPKVACCHSSKSDSSERVQIVL